MLSIVGAGATLWQKPLVNSVSLPAHAVTTMTPPCGGITAITVESTEPPNNFERIIALVNENDQNIGSDGTSGQLIINETNLPAGTYRVFGDSEGPAQHEITVTAVGCGSITNTVETTDNACTTLIATIELPSGVITASNGEIVSGNWGCGAG